MPVSFTDTTTSPPCRSAVSQMRPPCSVYLAALLSRFANTWASRVGSASRWTGSGGRVTVEFVAACLDERAAGLHGALHHRRQFDPLLAEFELAPGDAGHVEQVVDQPHHLLHLPLHHARGPARSSGRVGPSASRRICRALRIGASGLRSSWASVARNSSLRRSASFRAASDLLALGDIAGIFDAPTMRPPESLIGEIVSEIGTATHPCACGSFRNDPRARPA